MKPNKNIVGEGCRVTVYETSDPKWVAQKLTVEKDILHKAWRKTNLASLPKTRIDGAWLFMERFQDESFLCFCADDLFEDFNPEWPEWVSAGVHKFEQFPRDEVKVKEGVYKALLAISRECRLHERASGERFSWDLHGGNIAKRPDGTLVLIDPIVL